MTVADLDSATTEMPRCGGLSCPLVSWGACGWEQWQGPLAGRDGGWRFEHMDGITSGHPTWLAGKWTVERGDLNLRNLHLERGLSTAMFDYQGVSIDIWKVPSMNNSESIH